MTDDHGETTGKSELQFRDPKRDRAYRPVGAEPQDKGFLRAWTGANGNKAETIRKVEATYGTCCESHASPKPIRQLTRRRSQVLKEDTFGPLNVATHAQTSG